MPNSKHTLFGTIYLVGPSNNSWWIKLERQTNIINVCIYARTFGSPCTPYLLFSLVLTRMWIKGSGYPQNIKLTLGNGTLLLLLISSLPFVEHIKEITKWKEEITTSPCSQIFINELMTTEVLIYVLSIYNV